MLGITFLRRSCSLALPRRYQVSIFPKQFQCRSFHFTRPLLNINEADRQNLATIIKSLELAKVSLFPILKKYNAAQVGGDTTITMVAMAARQSGKPLTEETLQALRTSYQIVQAQKDWTADLEERPMALLSAAIDHAMNGGSAKQQPQIDAEWQNKVDKAKQRELNEKRIQEAHQAREAKRIQEELDRNRPLSSSPTLSDSSPLPSSSPSPSSSPYPSPPSSQPPLDTVLFAESMRALEQILPLLKKLSSIDTGTTMEQMYRNGWVANDFAISHFMAVYKDKFPPEIAELVRTEYAAIQAQKDWSEELKHDIFAVVILAVQSLLHKYRNGIDLSSKPIILPPAPSPKSSSTTTTPKSHIFHSSSSVEPQMPWLINVNADSLQSPNWKRFVPFLGVILFTSGPFAAISSRPSKVLDGAQRAIESFAAILQQGDLAKLQLMLAPHLYNYFEKLLQTYKEKKITMELNMSPIKEAFFTEVGMETMKYPAVSDEFRIQMLPNAGAGFKETNSALFAVCKESFGVVSFVQASVDPNTQQLDDKEFQLTMKDRFNNNVGSFHFSVYVNCNETYYLKDEHGKIIEGSEHPTENGHLFTFYSTYPNLNWQIVDLNNFNEQYAEEIPLFQKAWRVYSQGNSRAFQISSYDKL